ncbi:MAG: hydroxypyruvate isomerase [Rhodoferax sp.]
MLRFAANLSMLYPEHAFMDRFAAAARSGFEAVEFLFPYAFEAAALRQALDYHGLQLVLHNLPAGRWEAGERGIACHPDRRHEFRDGVERAIAYAQVLGVRQLNCLVGKVPPEATPLALRNTLVENLGFAAAALERAQLTLLIEPLNTFDVPGFYLHHTDQALALMDEVAAPNLRLQYDLYHAQRMQGELVGTLERLLPRMGHIQLADNPGRHEPGSGEIRYACVFDALERLGYSGHIGCEYLPAQSGPGGTDAGLHWLAAHGQSLAA